jgi:DNA-binding HxlR family transcriptional regulator
MSTIWVVARSYDQFCPLARSLDVIGERWTLLVIRELRLGPKRFTDLLNGLPGIGPTLLARRLKGMQAAGLVARTKLPPPAGVNVYELTEAGKELGPAMVELSRWGARYMGTPMPSDQFRLGWLLAAQQAMYDPEAIHGVRETYELRIADEVYSVRVDDGGLEIEQGPSSDPDLVVTTDYKTLFALGTGQLSPSEAVRLGRARMKGDFATAERCVEILRPRFRDSVARDA